MKWVCFVCVVLIGASCTYNIVPEPESNNSQNKRPQTIFEGTWTWLKTEGVGIAGPYASDSSTTGYSIRYHINFSQIEIFHDVVSQGQYNYIFSVSDDAVKQILTLRDTATNDTVDQFLWKIYSDDGQLYMTLSNVEECCDNDFIHYLKLISAPDLGDSK